MTEARWLQSLYTDGSAHFVSPPHPKLKESFSIRLRVLADNPIEKIYLRTCPEGEEVLTPMRRRRREGLFQWYQVRITMLPQKLGYRFKVVTSHSIYWYNSLGIQQYLPLDIFDFKIRADFSPISWLEKRVFYQIFPDSFHNSNPRLNPSSENSYTYFNRKPVFRPWDSAPREYNESKCLDFYGGDLQGIEGKISYLKNLGVNALYLNPIFQAPSNHRYDVQDYYKIDPFLGTNQDFANLCQKAHEADIRIVVDGVFNHTGIACRWFNKCKYYEGGAYRDKNSPYYDFYSFQEHPRNYSSWCGIKSLPKLNFRSEKLRDILYRQADSVMKYWLREPFHMDGWRLDVANMIAREEDYQEHLSVLAEMRTSIKSAFPNTYILGEHFFDGCDFLQGNTLDATMNYIGFTRPVREWLSGKDLGGTSSQFTAKDLDLQLTQVRSQLSWNIARQQYNLLNCHDLPRLSHLISSEKEKLALIFLFTYLGVPAVYYGDEIGISAGSTSESSRHSMPWDENRWDQNIQALYQKLIALRKNRSELDQGGIKTLYAENNVYSFARFDGENICLVILNRGEEDVTLRLDTHLVGIAGGVWLEEFFNGEMCQVPEDGYFELKVRAYSGMVYLT